MLFCRSKQNLKTTSDYLFRLIHSMTRNEKGYFKKQVQAHSIDANEVQYLKIFDAIDNQEVYNEIKLLDNFRNEKFVSQFSVAKNYLIFLVLKSLVQFHSGKNAESVLNRELDISNILFIKGFYKEGTIQLSKAKRIAYKFDKHDYLLTIIKREKQLIASLKNENMVSDLQKLFVEKRKVLETLHEETKLGEVYYSFLNEIHKSRIRNRESEHKELDNLRSSLPCEGALTGSTFNIKNYFYGIQTIYNYLINNFDEAMHYGQLHRRLWEGNKERFNDENDDYMEVIYHYISSCFQTKNYFEINQCLTKIKNLETDEKDKKQRKYFIYYTLKLRYCASLALYDESESLLDEIENNAAEIGNELYPSYKITLHINCTISYFVLEEYKKSLVWLNGYLNNLNKDFRKDAYSFARIFNLMVHYKLGNNDLLEHVIKNTYREIRKQPDIFEYEKVIILFIKKIAKNNSKKNVIPLARELQGQLKTLNYNPIEREAMRYFNFIRWLESEIQQVPYRLLTERELKAS